MPQALALRHTPYVDVDLVGAWLRDRGYTLETHDVPARFDPAAIAAADVLVILGGNMGVYETAAHPWLVPEIEAIRARLADKRPTLGLCLGAQLMAAALGATVVKGAAGQEIGWRPLTLTSAGERSPLAPLGGARVMQWHGDTFALPPRAAHLAASETYANQAFSAGRHALALQFHLETTPRGLELWLADHDHPELAELGLTEDDLRREARESFPPLRAKALAALDAWLAAAL